MGYEASLLSLVQLGEGVKLGRAPILLWQVTHYPQGSFIITDSLIKRMPTGKIIKGPLAARICFIHRPWSIRGKGEMSWEPFGKLEHVRCR